MNKNHVVVVGGGISGLSTAFFLSRRASEDCFPLRITVLEASNRFGGVLRTLSHDGQVMEAGADAFYSGRSDATDLCFTLGLKDELVEVAPCFRRFFILKDKKYFPIPALPLSFSDAARFFKNSTMSFSAKCRMLWEPFIPPRAGPRDESVADFICRRLGRGFYREIAKPLIQGVYMADPERLSLEAMFSRLRQAEKGYGSLAGSFLSRQGRKEKKSGGEFSTLKNGLEGLVSALVSRLGACEDWPSRSRERAGSVGIPACELQKSAAVKQCAYGEGWELLLEDGEKMRADVLCLAMGSCDASKLLSGAVPELSRELAGIRYDSIAAVNLIYRSEDVSIRSPSCGFLVPAARGGHPFSSLKWLGKSPDGKYLSIRAFISEAMLPGVFHENDETLGRKLRVSLHETFGMPAIPWFMSVERYPHALPQYETGHLERVSQIEAKIRQYPGLYLTGNGFHGFGITDCIRQARIAASEISSRPLGNLWETISVTAK